MHQSIEKRIAIERRDKLAVEEFQENYLALNKPLIVTDAMTTWEAKKLWNPEYFKKSFGNLEVPLYDNLFDLMGITSLREYIEEYFNKPHSYDTQNIPYIRWYTRFKDYDFEWADSFFDKISKDWGLPYFLPSSNYLLPYCIAQKSINPVYDNFPAKGIFISGKGAKTRLHVDPWGSDAVLCQVYGKKEIIIYTPDQKNYLTNNDKCINTDKPDLQLFPNYPKAVPTFIDVLEPGEIVFLPHGWFHQVDTIQDSISITWNFVHISTWASFFQYLISSSSCVEELNLIKFFLRSA